MARYTLRNKQKLINSFGEDYYNLLIASLDTHFQLADEIKTVHGHPENREYLLVRNIQAKTDSEFQFVVLRKVFDVYNLAYYSAIS